MRYVVTLTNVSRADSEKLGFRASDLGIVREKGFNVPLSFVVSNEAFEDFMAENGLRAKISRLLEEKDPEQAYPEILALFQKSEISKDLREEILEGYESLMIEPGSSAHSIISEVDLPFVVLVRSPTYLLKTDDDEGIIQNIKGKEMLLEALKVIWASIYSVDSMAYRRRSSISDNFSLGVVVQKMKKTKASAVSYSKAEFNDFMIAVKSWKGLQDYGENILGKDYYEVDLNSLLIKKSEVNHQEYEITRDIEKDDLVKRQLLDEGARQKLNDKLVSECARITKRCKSFIGKDIKIHFAIHDDYVNVLQLNRMTFEEKFKVEEEDNIDVTIDDAGKESFRQSHDFTAMKSEKPAEKFELPPIISHDEAKEHVAKSMAHKLFSLEGFGFKKKQEAKGEGEEKAKEEAGVMPGSEENLAEGKTREIFTKKESPKAETSPEKEMTPKAEVVKLESDQEQQMEKEESLLEQVLAMKDLIEKMEEHALNNNKEAYDQEARKLKAKMRRVSE